MSRYGFSDHLNMDQAKKIVKDIIKNSKSGEFFISSSNFYLVLQRTAIKLGYIENPHSIHTDILSRNDELKCIDELWNYVLIGVLSPGSSQNYSDSKFFPHLHLTEYGKAVIENRDFDPYNSERYFSNLMETNANLVSLEVKTLLLESLQSFKLNCYFSSMVLLGMCVETIFKYFIDKMKNYIKIEISHSITTTFKNILEILEPIKNKMPINIGQNLEFWLNEIFNYIRQTRNEFHQPIVNIFSREEVYSALLKFPYQLSKLNSLLSYFKDKKQ